MAHSRTVSSRLPSSNRHTGKPASRREAAGDAMSKELFVSSTPHETKVAIVEDDQLAEIYFERENEYTLAGSVYKGRVTRVLPGMQSAFVDIGLERDAFLYVTDFLEEQDSEEDIETTPAPQQQQRGERRDRPRQQTGPVEPIEAPLEAPIEAEDALAREAEQMHRQAEHAQGAGIDSAEPAEEELDDEAEGEEQATAE